MFKNSQYSNAEIFIILCASQVWCIWNFTWLNIVCSVDNLQFSVMHFSKHSEKHVLLIASIFNVSFLFYLYASTLQKSIMLQQRISSNEDIHHSTSRIFYLCVQIQLETRSAVAVRYFPSEGSRNHDRTCKKISQIDPFLREKKVVDWEFRERIQPSVFTDIWASKATKEQLYLHFISIFGLSSFWCLKQTTKASIRRIF